MQQYDLIIIGGGAAGLMAAITAKEEGINSILILERENTLGGSLNEYIHSGFGIATFKKELTGPEVAQRLIDKVMELQISYKLNTMVLKLKEDKIITYMNKDGIKDAKAKAIILAMGCRERPRGAMSIPKTNCSGIFTAGSAQKFVNVEGFLPGKEVVILGSGDMGAIIARRLIIEGAKVKAVVEHMPHVTAAEKNINQCYKDFQIPFLFSHTITEIRGKDRVEGVIAAKVDENKKPVVGTEQYLPCDSLILSIGLFPENELSRKAKIVLSATTRGPEVDANMHTSKEGVFACGSVVHVHNMVDHVVEEAKIAARGAASYIQGISPISRKVKVVAGYGIKYAVPQYIDTTNINGTVDILLKVDGIYENKSIAVYFDNNCAIKYKQPHFTTGNIECVKLTEDILMLYKGSKSIEIKVEE